MNADVRNICAQRKTSIIICKAVETVDVAPPIYLRLSIDKLTPRAE